tara:strand:+ start:37554 stop:37973 length:420 start_codon:yes stop_codon:yes gene_type:complete
MSKVRIGTFIGTGSNDIQPEITWKDQTKLNREKFMTGNNNKAGFSLPSEGAECELNPVDKPTELYNAVVQMRYLTNRIDELYDRINSNTDVGCDKVEQSDEANTVPLLEVLNECPRIIRDHLDYQHQRIIDIEQSIFNR